SLLPSLPVSLHYVLPFYSPPYWPISSCGSTTRGSCGRRSSNGGRSPLSTSAASMGDSPTPSTCSLLSTSGSKEKKEHPAVITTAAAPAVTCEHRLAEPFLCCLNAYS